MGFTGKVRKYIENRGRKGRPFDLQKFCDSDEGRFAEAIKAAQSLPGTDDDPLDSHYIDPQTATKLEFIDTARNTLFVLLSLNCPTFIDRKAHLPLLDDLQTLLKAVSLEDVTQISVKQYDALRDAPHTLQRTIEMLAEYQRKSLEDLDSKMSYAPEKAVALIRERTALYQQNEALDAVKKGLEDLQYSFSKALHNYRLPRPTDIHTTHVAAVKTKGASHTGANDGDKINRTGR